MSSLTSFSEIVRPALVIVAGLFPIVNPLGGAPIFLILTHDCSSATREALARRVAFNGFVLLLVSIFIGTHILGFFGVSVPVVQVGGGLLVSSMAWKLVTQGEGPARPAASTPWTPEQMVTTAFYPLTLPVTVGPGSIAVAITLGANAPVGAGEPLSVLIGVVAGVFLIAASIYLSYSFAERLSRLLGPSGMSVFLRLSSFILLCIGIQIIWNGVSGLMVPLVQPLQAR